MRGGEGGGGGKEGVLAPDLLTYNFQWLQKDTFQTLQSLTVGSPPGSRRQNVISRRKGQRTR